MLTIFVALARALVGTALAAPAQLAVHSRAPGFDDPVLYPPEVFATDDVGGGEIRVGNPDANGAQAALVLEHTSVYAEVAAGLASVEMTQWFANPFDVPIEATYLLPLPEGAAVNHMDLVCGDRVVEGFVMERDEARAAYDAAKQDGRKAALLEQERDNLFRQSIANLCPGEEVEIRLRWVEQVAYEDGIYSWTLPMTVGPRFSPPWVEDAERIATPYADDGRRADVTVAIEEGLPVEGLWSDTHEVVVDDEGPWGAEVSLADGETIPNADFTLTWTLGGDVARASAVVTRPTADEPGYIALTVEPPGPGELDVSELRPRELIFIVDESCSMEGEPYEVAKAAINEALQQMTPRDTFNLVRFSEDTGTLFETSQPSTRETRAAAKDWMATFLGGGTYMERGLVAALDGDARPGAMRLVLMLTDGFVGDDDEIRKLTRQHLGKNRVFALGVSESPNRSLLSGLAEMGRGAVLYHRPGASIRTAVDTFYARIARPAMTDIRVDWGGIVVSESYPSRIPDLWAGQPLRVVSRYDADDATEANVTVSGIVGTHPYTITVPVTLPPVEPAHAAVATLWARQKVHDLDGAWPGHAEGARRDEIIDVALEHDLVTRYTSLVAIDDAPSTCGVAGVTIAAPNETPSDMSGLGMSGYGSGGGGFGYGYGTGLLGSRGSSKLMMHSLGTSAPVADSLGGDAEMAGLSDALIGVSGVQVSGGAGAEGRSLGASGAAPVVRPPVSAHYSVGVTTVEINPIIMGSLDKSLIEGTIKRHLNELRYCYQRELQKSPTLTGRVDVKFVIGANGSVMSAEIRRSTLANPVVEACIQSRFTHMLFPQPGGGGIVLVTYPFLFSPG